uniref:Uncharacterized protein n=1 Tax=Neogobius melanostomus TaxID=47308 RepID=A0A8C6UYY9_9GOBI
WGVTDEGHFFCRNCHMVIEPNCRSSVHVGVKRFIGVLSCRGRRQWSVCEGFQFILRTQAEALIRLGVHPSFKDEVLVHLWRLYLQKTDQAYTHTPVRSATFRPLLIGPFVSRPLSDWSVCLSDWSLGSLDSDSYLSQTMKRRSRTKLMSMRKTLALLHVALTWSRQSLTLSELLRLVEQGHVPYVNSYECFPEEMKLSNRDALIFRVQVVRPVISVRSPRVQEPHHVPPTSCLSPISSESPLHPLNLSLRLLTDLNLPDETAEWVESVLERADLMRPARLTFDPSAQRRLPHYELLSASAVVLALKLLFGLDDITECLVCDVGVAVFSLRRWYRLLQRALLRARGGRCSSEPGNIEFKVYFLTSCRESHDCVAEQLTSCFKRLTPDRHGDTQGGGPSSFRFLWGRSPSADGPSLHHMTLEGGARTKDFLSNENYWHPPLQSCRYKYCKYCKYYKYWHALQSCR